MRLLDSILSFLFHILLYSAKQLEKKKRVKVQSEHSCREVRQVFSQALALIFLFLIQDQDCGPSEPALCLVPLLVSQYQQLHV